MNASPEDDLTVDLWLGGRLTLIQPRRGHRIGSDSALLAAAVDLFDGQLVDVGAGVGSTALAMIARQSASSAVCVEIDATLAAIAAKNAVQNGLSARIRVVCADVFDAPARREAGLADEAADVVVTNPPFFEAGAVRASPDRGRARAHVFPKQAGMAPLAQWIRACLVLLKPGGRFAMIHRPDALASILAAAEPGLGALNLLPVYPRNGAPAHRLVVSGVKGSRAPLRIAGGLVLHADDGRMTPEADAIHRGDRLIDWGAR